MKPGVAQVAAVILAGGKSSRFGGLGRILPKCLLPVPGEETLLTRLLGQLRSAGIRQTVVGCSLENRPLIHAFLEGYRNKARVSRTGLTAVACSSSRLGPLPALAEALRSVRARWYLLCLADIYFANAPFRKFVSQVDRGRGLDGCLITGADQSLRDGAGTGSVACDQKLVHAISYWPFGPTQPPPRRCRRWSGTFFFRADLVSDLTRNLAGYREAPLEAWIQGLLERGAQFGWIEGGPFVNVNSMRDYHFLVGHPGNGTNADSQPSCKRKC